MNRLQRYAFIYLQSYTYPCIVIYRLIDSIIPEKTLEEKKTMFILTTKNQLEKAIAKAKKVRCSVKFRSFGN